jgi:very-short-patch-repair endonuclease
MSRKIKSSDFPNLINLYNSGWSINKLSKFIKIDRGVITRLLSDELIKSGQRLRTQSEAERCKWSQMSKEQKYNQLFRAWNAVKGKQRTQEELFKRAETSFKTLRFIGKFEPEITKTLLSNGIKVTPQKPIGPYLVDIALDEFFVAVEVETGSGCRSTSQRYIKRLKYIFNKGWTILFVFIPSRSERGLSIQKITKQIIFFSQSVSRDHSIGGQYGVIGSNAQTVTPLSYQFDSFSRVPGF